MNKLMNLLKDAYYKMSDGVYGMKRVAAELNDDELKAQAKKVQDELDKLRAMMDAKYNWD